MNRISIHHVVSIKLAEPHRLSTGNWTIHVTVEDDKGAMTDVVLFSDEKIEITQENDNE